MASARPIAAGTPVTSQKKSRSLWKRETVQVRSGRQITLGLSFLSTPETERCSNSDYNYLIPSGAGVCVYTTEGVDPNDPELQALQRSKGGEDLRNWRPDGDSTSDGYVPPPGQW